MSDPTPTPTPPAPSPTPPISAPTLPVDTSAKVGKFFMYFATIVLASLIVVFVLEMFVSPGIIFDRVNKRQSERRNRDNMRAV